MSIESTNRSATTSVLIKTAQKRAVANSKDYFVKSFDGDFLDIVKELVFPYLSQEQRDEVIASIHHPSVTKSFYNKANMLRNFEAFLGPEKPNGMWRQSLQRARSCLEGFFNVSLQPLVYNTVDEYVENLTNPKASAGILGQGSKLRNAETTFEWFNHFKAQIAEGEEPSLPAVSFHRSQFSNYMVDGHFDASNIKHKDRLVFGVDAATVAVESQYAIPFMSYLKKMPWYAGGKDPSELSYGIKQLSRNGVDWTSLDFSNFDATVPSWLIEEVFDIIKGVFPKDSHKELDWIRNRFIHTDLVLPDGSVQTKHRGIPSGSFFTQAVGSMCNYLIIASYLLRNEAMSKHLSQDYYYVFELKRDRMRYNPMMVMGDDNLVFTTRALDLHDLSGYVKHVFGMVISPDKTDTGGRRSKPARFLKREWRQNGDQYRNIVELLINTIHSERKRNLDRSGNIALLYGLFFTYKAAFREIGIDQFKFYTWLGREGVSKLVETDAKYLPGSLRMFGNKAGQLLADSFKAPVWVNERRVI